MKKSLYAISLLIVSICITIFSVTVSAKEVLSSADIQKNFINYVLQTQWRLESIFCNDDESLPDSLNYVYLDKNVYNGYAIENDIKGESKEWTKYNFNGRYIQYKIELGSFDIYNYFDKDGLKLMQITSKLGITSTRRAIFELQDALLSIFGCNDYDYMTQFITPEELYNNHFPYVITELDVDKIIEFVSEYQETYILHKNYFPKETYFQDFAAQRVENLKINDRVSVRYAFPLREYEVTPFDFFIEFKDPLKPKEVLINSMYKKVFVTLDEVNIFDLLSRVDEVFNYSRVYIQYDKLEYNEAMISLKWANGNAPSIVVWMDPAGIVEAHIVIEKMIIEAMGSTWNSICKDIAYTFSDLLPEKVTKTQIDEIYNWLKQWDREEKVEYELKLADGQTRTLEITPEVRVIIY